jgi:hypothetical protein
LGFDGDYGDDVLPSIYANEVVEQGVLLFIAAGNEGPDNHTIGTPGSASKVLTIGAVSDPVRGGYGIAYFSSRGPTSDNRIKPDICAPGVGIQSISAGTVNGYINQSGTSMATPFATGVAALMMQANPNLALEQIKDILIDTAHDEWGFDGADAEYGHGVINPFGAVQAAKGVDEWRSSPINNQSNRGHLFQPNTKHKYKMDITPDVKTALITVYRNEKRLGYQPPENYYFRYTSTYNAKFKLAVVTPSGKRIEVMKTPLEYMANTDDTRFAQWEYQPTELGSHIIEVENTKGFLDYMIDVNLHGIKNEPHLLAVDFSKGTYSNIDFVPTGVEKWQLTVDMGGGSTGELTATARGPFIKLASGALSGVYVSEAIELSAIKKVGLSSCSVYGFTINIPGVLKQTGLFEYSLDNKTTWNKIKLQGPIPGLSPYDDLTGKKIYFRVTLTTDNANYTPAITNIEYSAKNLID